MENQPHPKTEAYQGIDKYRRCPFCVGSNRTAPDPSRCVHCKGSTWLPIEPHPAPLKEAKQVALEIPLIGKIWFESEANRKAWCRGYESGHLQIRNGNEEAMDAMHTLAARGHAFAWKVAHYCRMHGLPMEQTFPCHWDNRMWAGNPLRPTGRKHQHV